MGLMGFHCIARISCRIWHLLPHQVMVKRLGLAKRQLWASSATIAVTLRPWLTKHRYRVYIYINTNIYIYMCVWYDMIWYDMMWCDMIWYDVIWYDMYVCDCVCVSLSLCDYVSDYMCVGTGEHVHVHVYMCIIWMRWCFFKVLSLKVQTQADRSRPERRCRRVEPKRCTRAPGASYLVYVYIYLCPYLSIYRSIYFSIYLSNHLIYLSMSLSIDRSIFLSI